MKTIAVLAASAFLSVTVLSSFFGCLRRRPWCNERKGRLTWSIAAVVVMLGIIADRIQ